MNFAAFTDLHSSIKTLRKIIKVISGKDVDAIVFTGDFVSLNQPITTELNNLEEMFLELDSLDIPVYFVWGNRDLLLFEALREEVERREERPTEGIKGVQERTEVVRATEKKGLLARIFERKRAEKSKNAKKGKRQADKPTANVQDEYITVTRETLEKMLEKIGKIEKILESLQKVV